ncbi:MAG: nucleobase:cation symporter-2 family protein [Gammaproteobacteria bacterium]|nr:nucleobase:cation symporter-2 family protein [Gammaproteobacteria bacterium]
MINEIHPVDQRPSLQKTFTLGLQHVLVMYVGAVAVPLIVGGALKLTPEQIGILISADLLACGIVTLIQTLGLGSWIGIRLPVMMGVTFAAVGPMVAFANKVPGIEGARMLFGAIIVAGILCFLLAPVISRLLRYFPPVVTGCIIAIIGISLMRVGVGWVMGGPAHLAESVDADKLVVMVDKAKTDLASTLAATSSTNATTPSNASTTQTGSVGTSTPATPQATPTPPPTLKLGPIPNKPNPNYANLSKLWISLGVLVLILLLVKYTKGFVSNVAILLGIVGGLLYTGLFTDLLKLDKVAKEPFFGLVLPFEFGTPLFSGPQFYPLVINMTLVMIVVMIESTGMFLALSDLTGKKVGQKQLSAGLRVDGIGTLIGGIFNTFPYTSFSQNVGLVSVTGVKSRWVCVAGGIILIVLSLFPKLSALIAAIPQAVLGGAGILMFGMVAATGIRILAGVDFKNNRFNLYIVAVSIGMGLVPMVAPKWTQHMPEEVRILLESSILVTSIVAVALNLFFNGGGNTTLDDSKNASMQASPH